MALATKKQHITSVMYLMKECLLQGLQAKPQWHETVHDIRCRHLQPICLREATGSLLFRRQSISIADHRELHNQFLPPAERVCHAWRGLCSIYGPHRVRRFAISQRNVVMVQLFVLFCITTALSDERAEVVPECRFVPMGIDTSFRRSALCSMGKAFHF